MAGLAGDPGGVVIELGIFHMRLVVMARPAAGAIAVGTAGNGDGPAVAGCRRIAAAADCVLVGAVAGGAGEVEPVGVHMHVDENVGLNQARIEVAVLDGRPAAALEMAGAAGGAAGRADILRDLFEVGRAPVRILVVGAGGVVADQAVDIFL